MKPLILSLALVVTIGSANAFARSNNPAPPAQSADPTKDPKAATAPVDPSRDPGVRKLSRRERKEAIAKLDQKYRDFLKLVEPIMLPPERNTFLVLESDPQRDAYIEEFWRVRDTDPKTAANEYRENYLDLYQEAQQLFKYISSDRARIYLTHGRPADRLVTECEKLLQPMEIWYYPEVPGFGHEVNLLFYQQRNGGDYKIWMPITGASNEALQDLVSQEALMNAMGNLQRAVQYVFFTSIDPYSYVSRIAVDCKDGRAIMKAINWNQQASIDLPKLFDPPQINAEDVGKLLRTAVISNPNAPKLTAGEVTVAYPGKRGGLTAVDMSVVLPRAQLNIRDINGAKYYNLDVNGEIIKDNRLFESYHYRFDFPAESAGDSLPVAIERYLRPADYTSRIKIVDANSPAGAEVILEKPITVPEVHEDPQITSAKEESSEAIMRIQDEVRSGESRLRIVPLPDDLISGVQHIDTMITGDQIKVVEFYLDGKKVMTKRTPPFALDLDLGDVPQPRRVKAVGLNAAGTAIAGDDIVLNAGQDAFRVRITSPRLANNVHGRLRVEIEAAAPEGKKIKTVELYLNETRLATLYSPPYVQTITVPDNLGIAYLRAVATLDDDTPPVEDVVFLNSPEFMQQVDVHLIELPTTVLVRGRPVSGLKQEAFKVLDEGKPIKISKFEYVQNLPLSVGMAIDTSASMRPRMLEAQKAGASFFQDVMKHGDQAFIVSFDTEPMLLQKWTRKFSDLTGGLASLRAEESTALYDAIVLSLYKFQKIKGQKALVVITDGKDTASKFSFDQALEYAKRAAVPIYAVAIGLRSTEIDTKYKLGRFASETGGNVYSIDDVNRLDEIYKQIENELRSQYIIGFYPPDGVEPGSKWRNISVEVAEGKAKTIRGYYP